jgi:hypothetical protein
MIELKSKKTYSDFWKCNLITTYAEDGNGKHYYIRRNDGVEFSEAADLPNEMRVAKGLEPYTYEATDIEVEEVQEL